MKQKMKFLMAVASFIAAGLAASSAQHHEHELKAPNGGRIVKSIEPHAEILVADDGQVRVTFLADDGQALKPEKQLITLVGGSRMDPVQLSFKQKGDSFVSEGNLPMEQPIPVVVQIQNDYGAETYRERFQLNMSSCPSCEYKEYACACHGEEESGHAH